jgi:hypothetical protein
MLRSDGELGTYMSRQSSRHFSLPGLVSMDIFPSPCPSRGMGSGGLAGVVKDICESRRFFFVAQDYIIW